MVDRGLRARSGETKDYEIGSCCFSDKYAVLLSKSKDWVARNQKMYPSVTTCLPAECCFGELALTIKLSVFVSNKAEIIVISSKCNLFLS